jgi:hypothetical protein
MMGIVYSWKIFSSVFTWDFLVIPHNFAHTMENL